MARENTTAPSELEYEHRNELDNDSDYASVSGVGIRDVNSLRKEKEVEEWDEESIHEQDEKKTQETKASQISHCRTREEIRQDQSPMGIRTR